MKYPSNWTIKSIGEVATIGSGKDYKHLGIGDVPVYGTGGVMTYVDSYLYDGESVGIGRKGTIDKPQFLKGKFWTVDTLFYTHSFIGTTPKFLYYLFSSINWKLYNEASGVPSLSKKTIETIDVLIPPLPVQQKIASILSKWDELIESQTKLIEAKEKQKTSLMQKLLTGEVRFPGFEDEDIIEGVLSDFVGLKHGYQFRKEDFVQNGIPVIKIGNVIGQNLSFEGVTYISETRLEKFRDFQIYNGDLLMSLTGNIGRVVEVQNLDIPVVQNYRVGKFYSLSEEVLSRDFLKYLLSSPMLLNQLLSYANQSAQANFGKQDMDKLSVTFPSNISEQKKVGGLLNKCDLELQTLKDELETLKRQKKGLMQQLLTGKIRVKA